MNAMIVLVLFFILLILSLPTLVELIAGLRLQNVPDGTGGPKRKSLQRGPTV